MDYLPIFAQIKGRQVLVVGGDEVALRKVALLLKAGAIVHIIAQKLHPELEAQLSVSLVWLAHDFDDYQSVDALFPYYLIYSATNNISLNQRVKAYGDAAHKFVNVVDQMEDCSFITPSIIDRSPIIVAVSSGGKTPVLTRLTREKLERTLSFSLGEIARIAGEYRDRVRSQLKNVIMRRRFWESLFESAFIQHIEHKNTQTATDYLEQFLTEYSQDNPISPQDSIGNSKMIGRVILVGAGPGDPNLLTIAALHAMQQADIVLYDYLVSPEILELVRRDARLICVGKRAGNHSVVQQETNRLLVEHALSGKTVVRLKGGDPFIFGRGAEELTEIQKFDIPFKIIPGITAAVGACSYAGIPLTHRDYSQNVSFITGHCRAEGDAIPCQSFAQGRHTLCIYMGAIKAQEISQQLITHGLSAHMPVAVISNGTCTDQKVLIGSLVDLPELVIRANAPILIVVGEVVTFHHQFAWFNKVIVG